MTNTDNVAGLVAELRVMSDAKQVGAHFHPLYGEAADLLESQANALREAGREIGILRDMLINPDPDAEPDNVRLHREKCDALALASAAEAERDDARKKAWKYLQECGAQARRANAAEARLKEAEKVIGNLMNVADNLGDSCNSSMADDAIDAARAFLNAGEK